MVVCPCQSTVGSVEMAFYRHGRFGRIQAERSKSDKWLGRFCVERPFCSVLERFETEMKREMKSESIREQCAKISIRFPGLHSTRFEVESIKLTMLPNHKSLFSVFTVWPF